MQQAQEALAKMSELEKDKLRDPAFRKAEEERRVRELSKDPHHGMNRHERRRQEKLERMVRK